MRRLFNRLLNALQRLIMLIVVPLSFLMIVLNFGYIVYYQIVCYDSTKVLIGVVSLYAMIHLNKSMTGGE